MKESPAIVEHVATPLLGVSTGLRSFTTMAAAAWFAKSGALPLKGTWASWLGHPASVSVLTMAAVAEYIGDKLPNAPDRTMPGAVVGKIILGGLVGAVVATASRRSVVEGAALGGAGAVAGTYGGFAARRGLTDTGGLKDLPVALVEDCIAVALAVGVLRQLTD